MTQDTVDRLEEKLNNCYSTERHEEFQTKVKTIVLDVLGHDDGKAIIKPCAKTAAKEYNEESTWRKLGFWLPVVISIVACAIAFFKP